MVDRLFGSCPRILHTLRTGEWECSKVPVFRLHQIADMRPWSPELIVRPVCLSPVAAQDFTAHVSQLFSGFLSTSRSARRGISAEAFATDGAASAGNPILSCCHSFTWVRRSNVVRFVFLLWLNRNFIRIETVVTGLVCVETKQLVLLTQPVVTYQHSVNLSVPKNIIRKGSRFNGISLNRINILYCRKACGGYDCVTAILAWLKLCSLTLRPNVKARPHLSECRLML